MPRERTQIHSWERQAQKAEKHLGRSRQSRRRLQETPERGHPGGPGQRSFEEGMVSKAKPYRGVKPAT